MAKREPKEGRYSKVTRRIWDSDDFCALSPAKPNAQTLWLRLLTGPELTNIPGLFVAREGGLADALGWSVPSLRAKLKEITSRGMVHFDRSKGLFWVPKAVNHNAPENPNVILGWRLTWKEMPDCEVKRIAERDLRAWCQERGDNWVNAFDTITGRVPERVPPNPSAKGPGNGSGNQEQEQEQEQEQDTPLTPRDEIQARAKGWLVHVSRGDWTQADFDDPRHWPETRRVLDVQAEVWRADEPRGVKDQRTRAIVERFAEGYSPDELCEAIRGSRLDDHILNNRQFQTIATLLKDGSRVDKYRALRCETPERDPEHANLEALLS